MTEFKPTWKNRRRVIFTTLIFCGLSLAYIMVVNSDSMVHQSLVLHLTLLAGSVIASYVFGAVWQDTTKIKTDGPQP